MRKRKAKRTKEEVKQVLESYHRSGLKRREYCERAGIPLSTLDYYRRRARPASGVRLVRVAVQSGPAEETAAGSFTLELANGRRIESGWGYREADLTRLIRVAEAE